jgi:hypothetical protein
MSPLRDKIRDWQQHLARYRRLSILFAEDEIAGRLCTRAVEMKHRPGTGAGADDRMLDTAILLAEINTFIAGARGAMFFASRLLRPLRLSGDDLREAAQLCREEAEASDAVAMRRALSSRALELQILGENGRSGGGAQ